MSIPTVEAGVKRKRVTEGAGTASIQAPNTWPSPNQNTTRHSSAAQREAYFRSLYQTGAPDFTELARVDPAFAAVLTPGPTGRPHLDFTSPKAVAQLTRTLLSQHFSLRIPPQLPPPDRLCPAIPNRHAYVRFVQDLLDSTDAGDPFWSVAPGPADGAQDRAERRVIGLDIGTGALAIYALLAAVQRPGWRMLATDVDETNHRSASTVVVANEDVLGGKRVRVLPLRTDKMPLVPLLDGGEWNDRQLDFVMTNPPFHASAEAMRASAEKKALPPSSACTGAEVEMLYPPDGEVGFVGRLVEESLVLRDRVGWYTALLGRKESVGVMAARLQSAGVDNHVVGEIMGGGEKGRGRTKRWIVAWSFGPRRPSAEAGGRPDAVILVRDVGAVGDGGDGGNLEGVLRGLVEGLRELIQGLDLVAWQWRDSLLAGAGRAAGNVWGRAWRRRKQRGELPAQSSQKGEDGTHDDGDDDEECALGFLVSVVASRSAVELRCRWLEGRDESLFTSFCGYLRSRLGGGGMLPPSSQHDKDASGLR